MNRKLFISGLTTIFALGFSACGSDDSKDVTGPNISLTKPINDETFTRGEAVRIEFDLADESGINNYKVDIHWSEGHEHTNTKSTLIEDDNWSFQKVYDDQKGKTKAQVIVYTDQIAANAKSGDYHLGIHATDMLGNESQKYIAIEVAE